MRCQSELTLPGIEAPVFELYSTLREELDAQSDDDGHSIEGDSSALPQPLRTTEEPDDLAILWAHHLLATSKRRDLVKWANELGIVGWAKPGSVRDTQAHR